MMPENGFVENIQVKLWTEEQLTPGVEVGETLEQLREVIMTLPHRELLVRSLVKHVLQHGAAVLQHLTQPSMQTCLNNILSFTM